jgi:hypothetical protein
VRIDEAERTRHRATPAEGTGRSHRVHPTLYRRRFAEASPDAPGWRRNGACRYGRGIDGTERGKRLRRR